MARRVVGARIKDQKNGKFVAIAIGKLKDADMTKGYRATLGILQNGAPLATGTMEVTPSNPSMNQKSGNEHLIMKFDTTKNEVVAILRRTNLDDADAEYKATVQMYEMPSTAIYTGNASVQFV